MCGIAGLINFRSSIKVKNTLAEMAQTLQHRGPDSEGIWSDEAIGVGLAHTRLAIIDLRATGSQPMKSKSGRYIIVFNGEIYNHLTIRRELQAQTNNPAYREFITDVHVEGVWDDHDYGVNDAGVEMIHKALHQQQYLDFLNVTSPARRERVGLYSSHSYGLPPHQVRVIFLDTRSFRELHVIPSVAGVVWLPLAPIHERAGLALS